MAINSSSGVIEGKYKKNDFSLKNAKSKIFLSLNNPLLVWAGVKNCNARLKCDAGEYGNEKEYLKFSGFNFGTAWVSDAQKRGMERTFNGKIAQVNMKYQDSYAAVSKLELAGRSDGEQLTSTLGAESISLQQNKIKYFAELIRLNLTGKTFNKSMLPKFLQTGLMVPALSVSRGKEQIKIVKGSLKTDSIFDNENNAYNWRRSLKNINLELAFDKISGIWRKINISSNKNRISAKAEVDLKNSALYLKKINAGANVENVVAYTKILEACRQ